MQAMLENQTALPPFIQYIQEKNNGSCSQLTMLKVHMVRRDVRSRFTTVNNSGTPRLAMAMRRGTLSNGWGMRKPQMPAKVRWPRIVKVPSH